MKRVSLLVVITGLIFLMLGHQAYGQKRGRSYGFWSVGLTAGTMHYQGDLDNNGFEPWAGITKEDDSWGNPLKYIRPGFGVRANYHFHPHMFVTMGLGFGWIGASDLDAKEDGASGFRNFRGLDFSSRITKFDALLTYEFFASDRHYRYRPKWSPFISAGVSVFRHNPFTRLRLEDAMAVIPRAEFEALNGDYNAVIGWLQTNGGQTGAAVARVFQEYYPNDERIFLQPLRTEGQGSNNRPGCEHCPDKPYSLIQFAIPMGLGVRYALTEKIDLRFEVTLFKTFTDHLDDVGSVRYADPQGFIDGRFDTDNAILSYLLSDRSRYRPSLTGYQTQQNYVDQTGNVIRDNTLGAEKRGFENQTDWLAFTGFSINFIIDKGDRCPKFR